MDDKQIPKLEQPIVETGNMPEKIRVPEKSPTEKGQERLSEINNELTSQPDAGKDIKEARNKKTAEVEVQITEIETNLGQSLSEESKNQIMKNNVDFSIATLSKQQERHGILEKQKQILEYVQRELPETELRISEPMRQDCKVAISIPAYEEGAKILDSLEFLSMQESVSKDEYEIIINVNNRDKANPHTRELNQQTLNILRFLNNETSNIGFLSAEEKEKIQKLKESGLVVHYIDKSSQGSETKPIDDEDFKKTGCMQPRKRTMDEICERFVLTGKSDGIIASLDADTKVNKKWVRQIIDTFNDQNVQLLAGERRDGLDINSEGTPISRDDVMERLLESWNSEERKKDEAFKELPNIEDRMQRAQILLMNHLIGAYNTARGHFRREIEGRTGTIEDFKGGSGKMFRVGTYARHPLEIIKIMDAGGKKPTDVEESAFKYVGRDKSEKNEPTTTNSEIEALAVYPEARIRGWDVKSTDQENPYQDFTAIHKPFGSSGKEYAYAIAAVLKEKIPTTYNEEAGDARQAIENFIVSGQTEDAHQKLEAFFDQDTIAQIGEITPDDLEKLKQGDSAVLDKYKMVIEKIKETSEKPVSVTEALRFYGKKYPQEQTFNPERYFIGVLVKEMMQGGDEEKSKIKGKIKAIYNLSDELIRQLSELKNESELLKFAQSNSEIQSILADIPKKIGYNEAADKYEKLINF